MARTATKTTQTETTKTTATKKTATKPAVKEEELFVKEIKEIREENDILKSELAELKELLTKQNEQLLKSQNGFPMQSGIMSNTLNNDTDITVISLVQGELNLTTEPLGKGIVYTFKKMYDEIDMSFEDLRSIVRSHREMAENGRFYITNAEAVNKLRLTHFYKNLLTPTDLKTLLNNSPATIVDIYSNVNDAQKEIILNMVLEEKFAGKVDNNVLFELEQASGQQLLNKLNPYEK